MATTNAQTFTIGGVTHQVEDTTARAGVSALQTALASLQSALDTLMGTDDITDEIDTYNEIKDFLDGFDVNDPDLSSQLALLNTQVNDLLTAMPDKVSMSALNIAVANLQALINGKVDAVNGKGLSTNDYTNEDKAAVATIANKANSADVYTKSQTYSKSEVDAKVADAGKVKSVTINGTKKTPNETTGDVDLGTVVGQQGPQGPAGPQGNSGVASADGVIVVNNLVEGGTDVEVEGVTKVKVLSAEMGKEIGDKLNKLTGIEVYTRDPTNDVDNKYIHYSTGNNWGKDGWTTSRPIFLKQGNEINVKITTIDTNTCVIAVKTTSATGFTDAIRIPYESNKTEYPYTASDGDKYVFICYKTADGFRATIETGNPVTKVDEKVDDIITSVDGVEIPFSEDLYYTISNGVLSTATDNAHFKRSTPKLTISDYEKIYYTGGTNIYGGYFVAIFFNSSDEFVGARFWNPITTTSKSSSSESEQFGLTFVNVLDDIPNGATKVALQSNINLYNSKVVVVSKKPYIEIAHSRYSLQDLYGVKGDGVTDDTSALQMMFNSAQGEVSLRPATYLISGTLLFNTMRCHKLKGNGATIVLNAGNNDDMVAIDMHGGLYAKTNNSASADPDKTPLQMQTAAAIIEDLRITTADIVDNYGNISGSGKGVGIKVRNCFMPIIRGCHIYNMKNGIMFANNMRNAIVEGCHIYLHSNAGILLSSGVNFHQCNITGNHISYCKYCIDFDEPQQIANFQITGNDIETSTVYPSGITEADKRCIRFNLSSSTQVCYEIEIVGNTIQGHGTSAGYLIELVGASKALSMSVSGNHFSNCGVAAVGIANASDISLSGNTSKELAGGYVYLSGTTSLINVASELVNASGKYLVSCASDATLSKINVNGCVANNSSVMLNASTMDYISVVGNCLGGGTVTIGDATHKQEANNI